MWFLTNNIDSHSIECAVYINIRVLRLRSTDWKSSLNKTRSNNVKRGDGCCCSNLSVVQVYYRLSHDV